MMASDKCIHPDCECLDYCEAQDPYSETPKPLSKEREGKEDPSSSSKGLRWLRDSDKRDFAAMYYRLELEAAEALLKIDKRVP